MQNRSHSLCIKVLIPINKHTQKLNSQISYRFSRQNSSYNVGFQNKQDTDIII